MFAVIRTGGKQYKVSKDDVIRVEKIDAKEGASVNVDVLYAEGGKKASVSAKVESHERADKIIVFKKKRRHNYRRKQGHQQPQTVIKITDVKAA